MTPAAVSIRNLTYDFGHVSLGKKSWYDMLSFEGTRALDQVDLDVRPGTITGLIGRNGAGKSTLASLIAGFRRVAHGSIVVDGESPWENPHVMERVCFMRDIGGVSEDDKTIETVRIVEGLRPKFDRSYFDDLMDMFGVPLKSKPQNLSRGQRSSLAASIALASRCDLTIVDEIHLGMDAVARRLFYDALMADYIAHPRTFIVSSHLLDEIENQLEDVIILHKGRVVDHGTADDVRARHSNESVASLTDILISISGGPQ